MSPSPALTTHTTAAPVADSPQPSRSPLTLSQQIQSPHHQQQSQPQPQTQTPSRSCTPSAHPPLFIIHNQIAESPQTAPQGQAQQTQPQTQQTHVQVQLQLQSQPQPRPASLPAPYQQDMAPMSQSPKHLTAPAGQHQFTAPPVSLSSTAVVKTQVPIQGLTAEQQHNLKLVEAQIQTLSANTQPSPQQKQLLDKLRQVRSHLTTNSSDTSLSLIPMQ